MALSYQQFQELRNKGLTVSQIQSFEGGQKPQDMAMQKQVTQQTAGNQFAQPESKGFMAKARDFVVGAVGGGKVAQGAGMALAAPSVQKNLSSEQMQTFDMQKKILERIRTNKAQGKDVSRLESALKSSQGLATTLSDAQQDFTEALPSNKEVIGSATRLATTAAGGAIARGATAATGARTAIGFGQGALRGAGAGALGGGVFGGLQGAGVGLEQNKGFGGVAASAGIGAASGAALGGVLGAGTGAIGGKINQMRSEETLLSKVTPKTSEISPTQYKKMRDLGMIEPRTATRPEQIKLTDTQANTAARYQHLVHKDPTKTVTNIADQVYEFDRDVGKFLQKNNVVYSKDNLKSSLQNALSDVTDVNVDEARLVRDKGRLIDNFIKSLPKSDTHSLWEARKGFDREIEKAFSGSPTIAKEVKIALRNSVQEFIGQYSPQGQYSSYMEEMRNLIDLGKLVNMKNISQRGQSGIGQWMKNNPQKVKAAWTVLGGIGVGTAGGYYFGHSRSDAG